MGQTDSKHTADCRKVWQTLLTKAHGCHWCWMVWQEFYLASWDVYKLNMICAPSITENSSLWDTGQTGSEHTASCSNCTQKYKKSVVRIYNICVWQLESYLQTGDPNVIWIRNLQTTTYFSVFSHAMKYSQKSSLEVLFTCTFISYLYMLYTVKMSSLNKTFYFRKWKHHKNRNPAY